jgi:hypothetical protein
MCSTHSTQSYDELLRGHTAHARIVRREFRASPEAEAGHTGAGPITAAEEAGFRRFFFSNLDLVAALGSSRAA